VIDGDVEHGSLMAGQSVGLVRSVQPIAEILAELVEQTAIALGRDDRLEHAPEEILA
jgi:enoyl-[acyl-carrier protein] reductase II